MKLLELDNVELYFGKKEILKGVYFKAEKGKITGILGSNGCGKTSLMKILFGALKPNNKLIRIDHKPILRPLYSKGIIHYLPQFHCIPDHLTLQRVFSLYHLSIESFEASFPSFSERTHRRFRSFSGGEKRLIEIYIAINSKAEIVLLDEPFSHLAPMYISLLKKMILQGKPHKCIIVTDHLYEDILDISDDLYLIKEGYTKPINSKNELVQYNYIRSL
jgi:ABC-type multidrug transport system ATPase subunit